MRRPTTERQLVAYSVEKLAVEAATTAITVASDLRRNIDELPGYKRCCYATEQAIVDYGFGDFVVAVKNQR